MQAARERASQNAALYVTGCQLSGNVVFHGVMLVKGQLRSWQAYRQSFLRGLLPGSHLPELVPSVAGGISSVARQAYTNETAEEGQENDYAASL